MTAVPPVAACLAIRRSSPGYASALRDQLHRDAARGRDVAIDTLVELIDADPWWARTITAPPATDALRAHAGRRPLFDADALTSDPERTR